MESALSGIAQASVQSQISYAVAAKAMDAMRQQGGAALSLLKGASEVQSSVARSDANVAAAVEELSQLTDENGRLDVTA